MTVTTAGSIRSTTSNSEYEAVAKVLHRVGFGASPAEVEALGGKGVGSPPAVVDRLLAVGRGDPDADVCGVDHVVGQILGGHDRLRSTMAAFWMCHLGNLPPRVDQLWGRALGPFDRLMQNPDPDRLGRWLWWHFAASEPELSVVAALSREMQQSNFEMLPVLERILTSEDFLSGTARRVRRPYEWFFGALRAVGITDLTASNVRLDRTWLGNAMVDLEAAQIAQTGAVLSWVLPTATIEAVRAEPDSVLAQCGIYGPSERTAAVLGEARVRFKDSPDLLQLLFALALTSPEFVMI